MSGFVSFLWINWNDDWKLGDEEDTDHMQKKKKTGLWAKLH